MAKVKKPCPTCKGTGKLPQSIAKQLPKPKKNIPCTTCLGAKYVWRDK